MDEKLSERLLTEEGTPELWDELLASLRAECPEAAELAELLTLLDCGTRIRFLLVPPGSEHAPEPWHSRFADRELEEKILDVLFHHHCISMFGRPYQDNPAFQAHVRSRLDLARRHVLAGGLLDWILGATPRQRDWHEQDQRDLVYDLEKQLEHLLQQTDIVEEFPLPLARILVRLASLHRDSREKTDPLLERALGLLRAAGSPDPLLEAEVLGSFSHYSDGAAERLQRAVELVEHGAGPQSIRLIEPLRDLGNQLQRQDDLAGAADCFQRALELAELHHGNEHPDLVQGLLDLADIWSELADGQAAAAFYERALAIPEQHFDESHMGRKTLAALSLAGQLRGLGRYGEAVRWQLYALEQVRAKQGPRGPEVAVFLYYVGHGYALAERWEEALDYLQQAERISEPAPRKEYEQIDLWLELGKVLFKLERHLEAIPWLDRALELALTNGEPYRYNAAKVRFYLGMTLDWSRHLHGRGAESRQQLEESLRVFLQLYDGEEENPHGYIRCIREHLAALPPSV